MKAKGDIWNPYTPQAFEKARHEGRVVVLEITTPAKPPLSTFFSLWFDRIVPLLGRFDEAYTYLPSSVKRFPGPQALAESLVAAGCSDVGWILTAGGIIAIHYGVKSPGGDTSASSTRADEGRVAG